MNEHSEDATPRKSEAARAGLKRWMRLGLGALVVVGAWAVLQNVDTSVLSDPEAMQARMRDAGALGIAAFLLAFSVGQLAQLPGLPFVVAARFAYGPVVGFAASYVAALLAVTATFLLVRTVGGKALSKIKWRWVKRVMARLEDKPIRTVALLRAFFAVSPPLNYALAMSPVRFRQHLAASAVGLLVPITIWVGLADVLMRWIA